MPEAAGSAGLQRRKLGLSQSGTGNCFFMRQKEGERVFWPGKFHEDKTVYLFNKRHWDKGLSFWTKSVPMPR